MLTPRHQPLRVGLSATKAWMAVARVGKGRMAHRIVLSRDRSVPYFCMHRIRHRALT